MFNGPQFGGNQFQPPPALMNPMGNGMEIQEVNVAQGQVTFAAPVKPALSRPRDRSGRRAGPYVNPAERPWTPLV